MFARPNRAITVAPDGEEQSIAVAPHILKLALTAAAAKTFNLVVLDATFINTQLINKHSTLSWGDFPPPF